MPLKFYPQATNKADVPTIGVRATLVASVNVPEDAVFEITREIYEDLDRFRSFHPVLGDLTRSEEWREALRGADAVIHMAHIGFTRHVIEACEAADVIARLIERGFAAGFPLSRYYKGMDNSILICVTEKRTKQQIGMLAEALESVL